MGVLSLDLKEMDDSHEGVFVDNQPEDLKIIREFYRNESSSEAQEYFETELELALESKVKLIVIEPKLFGESTARYIYIGNILEKSAILSSIASIVSALLFPEKTIIYLPLSTFSIICTSLYSISWSTDPCSNYRVVSFDESSVDNDKELKKLRECLCCENPTPIILHKNDGLPTQTQKNLFHRSLSFLATILSSYRFYELIKFAKFV